MCLECMKKPQILGSFWKHETSKDYHFEIYKRKISTYGRAKVLPKYARATERSKVSIIRPMSNGHLDTMINENNAPSMRMMCQMLLTT